MVNYNGEAFSYDVVGNPTTYRGNTLKWEKGNQLKKFGNLEFVYNGKGQRLKKGNIVYTYANNGNLIYQTDGETSLGYYYDVTGVCAIRYKNRTYGLRKNAQGDIIAIYNAYGNVIAKYVYDAWGNHAIIHYISHQKRNKELEEQIIKIIELIQYLQID